MDKITITIEEYEKLKKDQIFLRCLEEAGINEWTEYPYACDLYYYCKEDELDKLKERTGRI